MLCIYLPTPRLNYLPPQKRQLQGADFQPLLHPQCLRVHRASIHTYYTLIRLMFLKSFLPSFVILRSGDLVLTSLRGCAQQAGEPPIVNLAVG